MGLKKMLLLLGGGCVAVLALAAYVVFVESAAPTTDEALKERGLVFPVKDDKNRTLRDLATKLEITRGKDVVVLEKADAQNWRLRKPHDARADRSAVLSILDGLRNLTAESFVQPASDTPEEMAKFGLKEPRITATFWLGDRAHEFAVGSEVKGQKSYEKRAYIRLKGESRLLVIANDLVEKLDKEPNGFRDKKVFERERDPEKARAVRVVSAERTLELEKSGKGWNLKAPVADLADASKVSSLLSKARNLEVEKFISEDPSKLGDYGLDKPQLTCEIKADDGSTMTLLVGKAPEGDDKLKDQLYAKRAEEPSIFTIKKDFTADVAPKLEDLRDRKVASFDDAEVSGIEFTRGATAWAVAREGKDKDWKLTKPRETKADQSSVSDILRHLGRLRVARWIDDPKDPAFEHLKQPEAVVTLAREPMGVPGAKAQPPVKLTLSAIVKKEKPAQAETGKEDSKDKSKDDAKDKPKEKEFEEGRYIQRDGQAGLLYVAGGKAPDGAAYDEKDSVEALNALAKTLDKGYLAVLDRKVFDFKSDAVVRLAIERGAAKLTCEKKDAAWKLTSPVALDADANNVNSILGVMNDLSADEYVLETPKPDDLKRYGLDAPSLRLTATIEEEAAASEKKPDAKADEKKAEKKEAEKKEAKEKKTFTKTLLLSRKIDGTTYGMEQGGTLVFTVKSWDADSLRAEVIPTALAEFAEADATSLTIAHRGKPEIVLEKQKDAWAITKPTKAEADQEAVRKVLDALHDLKGRRCIDFEGKDLAAYGLEPAEVVVTVKVKDKPDAVVKIGKPLADEKEDPGSAAVKGDAKQVFLMPKGKVDDIAKSLADLEKKPEPKAEAPKKEEPKAKEDTPAPEGNAPKAK